MIADGNSSDDGGAAVAATIGNERAAARWVSDRPSIVLPAPGGQGGRTMASAQSAEHAARAARTTSGFSRAEPAAVENFKFSIQNSAGALILSMSNEPHPNNHLRTLVGRRRRGTTDGSDVWATGCHFGSASRIHLTGRHEGTSCFHPPADLKDHTREPGPGPQQPSHNAYKSHEPAKILVEMVTGRHRDVANR